MSTLKEDWFIMKKEAFNISNDTHGRYNISYTINNPTVIVRKIHHVNNTI